MLTNVQRFSLLTILPCAAIFGLSGASIFGQPAPAVAIATGGPVCNTQKSVKIGCPIPQRNCMMYPCDISTFCPLRTCWTTVGVHSGEFRCDPCDPTDLILSKTWMCYPKVRVITGPTGPITFPVLGICLNIQFCKWDGVEGTCVADATKPGTKYSLVYGTTSLCTLPS